MKRTVQRILNTTLQTLLILLAIAGFIRPAVAQSPELQPACRRNQRIFRTEQAGPRVVNTWNEQVTISLKGEEKKQQHFQVRLWTELTPQKVSLDPPPEPPSGGRLKQRVVANKKEEYTDYADKMKALAEQYVPPYST